MPPVRARVAVVVPEVGLRDEREDEARDGALLRAVCCGRENTGGEASDEEEGCRPMASHREK